MRPLGIYDDVAEACYSTLGISKAISLKTYKKKFYQLFKNPLYNFGISILNFKKIFLFSDYTKSDSDYYRLINVFKREIHSFVATLGEDTIECLLKIHNLLIGNADAELPTKYF